MALISMRNNEIRLEKILAQKKMKEYYFGSDDSELIQTANLAKSPEEAKLILDEMKITDDEHMRKRREGFNSMKLDR